MHSIGLATWTVWTAVKKYILIQMQSFSRQQDEVFICIQLSENFIFAVPWLISKLPFKQIIFLHSEFFNVKRILLVDACANTIRKVSRVFVSIATSVFPYNDPIKQITSFVSLPAKRQPRKAFMSCLLKGIFYIFTAFAPF